MLNTYPLKFKPLLKPVIWGGNKIGRLKGLVDIPENVGESWELTGVPGHESVVVNGEYSGMSIKTLLEKFGSELVGRDVFLRYGTRFPIMVKFIDAAKDLSIQVHPNDDFARQQHNCLGKTELWYVMHSDNEAVLYSGFMHKVTADDFKQQIETGTVVEHLNRFHPRKGDVFYLPAGRIHSIGAGNFIVEIQQSSDVTYRVYDFDRIDKDGKKRELHTDLAMQSIDFGEYDDYKCHLEMDCEGIAEIKRCDKFVSMFVRLEHPMQMAVKAAGSFKILICLSGKMMITSNNGAKETLAQCETVLLPYAMDSVRMEPLGNAPVELISVTVE